MTKTPNDLPFEEACRRAAILAEQGYEVYQKFTCDHCGQRLTIEEPNTFHSSGTCDKCGKLTEIHRCGFLVAFMSSRDPS